METAPVQSTSLAILNDPQGSDHTKNYVSQTGRGLGSAVTRLQILVEGLPADAKLPGDFGLADAGRNPRAQLHDGRGGEGLLASLVGAPLLGERNAFALALMDESPLEFGKGPHHR